MVRSIILLFVLVQMAYGQDRIINKSGKIINAKVTSFKDGAFSIVKDGKKYVVKPDQIQKIDFGEVAVVAKKQPKKATVKAPAVKYTPLNKILQTIPKKSLPTGENDGVRRAIYKKWKGGIHGKQVSLIAYYKRINRSNVLEFVSYANMGGMPVKIKIRASFDKEIPLKNLVDWRTHKTRGYTRVELSKDPKKKKMFPKVIEYGTKINLYGLISPSHINNDKFSQGKLSMLLFLKDCKFRVIK